MEKAPYFKRLLTETPEPSEEQTSFPDEDDFAIALFAKWVSAPNAVGYKALGGPTDFHSTQHYLELYVLARRWGCEGLENYGLLPIYPL